MDSKVREAVELLPCPFCGGLDGDLVQGFTRASDDFAFWSVECVKCGVEVASDASQAEADAHWNMRAPILSAMPKTDVPAVAVGWQPIESAPHEVLILLYWMDWADREYMEAGYASTGSRTDYGSSISHHGDATHWMPLPASPSPTSREPSHDR